MVKDKTRQALKTPDVYEAFLRDPVHGRSGSGSFLRRKWFRI